MKEAAIAKKELVEKAAGTLVEIDESDSDSDLDSDTESDSGASDTETEQEATTTAGKKSASKKPSKCTPTPLDKVNYFGFLCR